MTSDEAALTVVVTDTRLTGSGEATWGGDTGAGRLFTEFYRHEVFGRVTLPMVVLAVFAVAGQYLLTRTAFGQQLKLVGSNPSMAAMTGVRMPRTVGLAFVLSALAASVGGIFITSLSKVGAYYNGEGYDFDAVTAVVLGGGAAATGSTSTSISVAATDAGSSVAHYRLSEDPGFLDGTTTAWTAVPASSASTRIPANRHGWPPPTHGCRSGSTVWPLTPLASSFPASFQGSARSIW